MGRVRGCVLTLVTVLLCSTPSAVLLPSSTIAVATTPSAAWRMTGSLGATAAGPTGRVGHTATLLPDGRVLVAGGFGTNRDTPGNAQLYDPARRRWARTASLGVLRAGHTATLLANGKVLVAGGFRVDGGLMPVELLDTCLLYDVATGVWTATGSFARSDTGRTARAMHTATSLPNGKVLVVGGLGVNLEMRRDAQLYDPATGSWSRTTALATGRAAHTATLLPNGTVLIAGGFRTLTGIPSEFLDSALIYTPVAGTWTKTGRFARTARGPQGRARHTATLLANGEVLIVGGAGGNLDVPRVPQIYDPATGRWRLGAASPSARMDHTATLLSDGKVLIAGGQRLSATVPFRTLGTALLYDPANGSWTNTARLNVARSSHTATLLPNGEVLAVAGLSASGSVLASAERHSR